MSYTEQSAYAPYPGPPAPGPTKGSNGLATAGFVLGLLGLLGSWIPVLNILSIILAVVGIVFGAIGLARSTRANGGRGLAIAGLVLGALGIVIAIVVNVAFVDAVDEAIDETTSTSVEAPSSSEGEAESGGDSASKDSELGTSRNNPAPLGSAVTGDNWTVTINSVQEVNSDSYDQAPAAGSTLLLINMTATYNGDDEQGSTAWASVKYVGVDGTTSDSTSGSTMFIAENGFDSLKTLYKGASVRGDELIEVPVDNWKDGVLAVSPGMLSDDTFIALK